MDNLSVHLSRTIKRMVLELLSDMNVNGVDELEIRSLSSYVYARVIVVYFAYVSNNLLFNFVKSCFLVCLSYDKIIPIFVYYFFLGLHRYRLPRILTQYLFEKYSNLKKWEINKRKQTNKKLINANKQTKYVCFMLD